MDQITTLTAGTATTLDQRVVIIELYATAAAREVTKAMGATNDKPELVDAGEKPPPVIDGKNRLSAEHSTIPPGGPTTATK